MMSPTHSKCVGTDFSGIEIMESLNAMLSNGLSFTINLQIGTFDPDLWPTQSKINKDLLFITSNHHVEYKIVCSRIIGFQDNTE